MLRCMTELEVMPAVTDFDRTTTLSPVNGRPGEFTAWLDSGWSSLVGVHGGYLSALAARGARAVVPDRAVRTLATSFLQVGRVGPASLTVSELRRGRSVSTVTVDVVQDDHVVTTTRLTMLTDRSGVEWTAAPPPQLPPVEHCIPVEPPTDIAHFHRVEGLLDPSSVPFSGGARAIVRGYLRPLETRVVDAAWLAMATDWFPPPAFVRVAPPTGGVSVDLTTHLHRPHLVLDEDEWLTGSFEVVTSTGGLAVEHGRIADLDGRLVAESFHTRLTAQDHRRS
jgi:acyl-CoA thioesterase